MLPNKSICWALRGTKALFVHGHATGFRNVYPVTYCRGCLSFNHTQAFPLSNGSLLEKMISSQQGLYQKAINSDVVANVSEYLQAFQSISGLPWWLTICANAIILRGLIAFPFKCYQAFILAKYENLQPKIKSMVNELKHETRSAINMFDWTEKEAKHHFMRSMKIQINKMIVAENCHPAKASLLIWIQMPTWVIFSFSIRKLVSPPVDLSDVGKQLLYTDLSEGGTLWFPNLVDIDHSLILPVTFGLMNLIIIELESIKIKNPKRLQKIGLNLGRLVSIIMVPISAHVPAAVLLYWTTSVSCALLHNTMLLFPKIRRIVRIPSTSSESSTPTKDVISHIEGKMLILRRLLFQK